MKPFACSNALPTRAAPAWLALATAAGMIAAAAPSGASTSTGAMTAAPAK